MPVHWQLWLVLLLTVNLVLPLFFLDRLEARIIVGALLASVLFMTILTGVSGFNRLLGLGHIFWIPLLYFLWMRLGQIPADDFFRYLGPHTDDTKRGVAGYRLRRRRPLYRGRQGGNGQRDIMEGSVSCWWLQNLAVVSSGHGLNQSQLRFIPGNGSDTRASRQADLPDPLRRRTTV